MSWAQRLVCPRMWMRWAGAAGGWQCGIQATAATAPSVACLRCCLWRQRPGRGHATLCDLCVGPACWLLLVCCLQDELMGELDALEDDLAAEGTTSGSVPAYLQDVDLPEVPQGQAAQPAQAQAADEFGLPAIPQRT